MVLKSKIKPSTPASFHNIQIPNVAIGLISNHFTSFGNSWIAGTHVLNKDKMSKRRNTSAQNIQSCVTPTKRATRQSKSTNKARHRHTYKGGPPTSHLAKAGGQRRQCGASRTPGSAEPGQVLGPLSFGRKVGTAIST